MSTTVSTSDDPTRMIFIIRLFVLLGTTACLPSAKGMEFGGFQIEVSISEGIFAYPKDIHVFHEEELFLNDDSDDYSYDISELEDTLADSTTMASATMASTTMASRTMASTSAEPVDEECGLRHYDFVDGIRVPHSPPLFAVEKRVRVTNHVTTDVAPGTTTDDDVAPENGTTSAYTWMPTTTNQASTDSNVTTTSYPTTTVETTTSPTITQQQQQTASTNYNETTTSHRRHRRHHGRARRSVADDVTKYDYVIVQLSDVDRERCDSYMLTFVCFNRAGNRTNHPQHYSENFDAIRFVHVTVDDVNDNSPRLVEQTLHARVPAPVEMGTVLLQVRATDADQPGPNSRLFYSSVPGTVRRKLLNETRPRGSPVAPKLWMTSWSGDVITLDELRDEMEIEMRVMVKDNGDCASGNRATAMAYVTVFNPENQPTPAPSSTTESGLSWWIVLIIAVLSTVVVVTAVVMTYNCAKRKGFMSFIMLRMNESTDVLLDNNEELENERV